MALLAHAEPELLSWETSRLGLSRTAELRGCTAPAGPDPRAGRQSSTGPLGNAGFNNLGKLQDNCNFARDFNEARLPARAGQLPAPCFLTSTPMNLSQQEG